MKLRFRRWTRFSLGTLLLAVVPVGIVLAMWLRHIEPHRRQARVVALLRQLEPRADGNPIAKLFSDDGKARIKSKPAGPAWARTLFGRDGMLRVTEVNALLTTFDNSTAAQVSHLTDLEELDVAYTSLGDEGARHFAQLHNLQRLLLGTQITDESLRHLSGLRKLERLELMETAITDAGLQHLRNVAASIANVD